MNGLITIWCGTCHTCIGKGSSPLEVQEYAEKVAIILPNESDGYVFHHPDCVVHGYDKSIRNPDKLKGRKQYRERVRK